MRALVCVLWMLVACTGLAGAAWAGQGVRLTGTYTQYSYNEMSGDGHGLEVRIVKALDGYQVVAQQVEGQRQPVYVSDPEITGRSIRFILDKEEGFENIFVGTVSSQGIRGVSRWKGKTIGRFNLKRGKGSLWDKRIDLLKVGTFADLKPGRKSGEQHGLEVWLVNVPGGHQAVVQRFEGKPLRLAVARAEIKKDAIRFQYRDPQDQREYAFQGALSREGIRGTLTVDGRPGSEVFLKRNPCSVWDR